LLAAAERLLAAAAASPDSHERVRTRRLIDTICRLAVLLHRSSLVV
jgi:hypothetical protein